MNYEDFICYVQREVQTKMGEGVRVELHRVMKNNSVQLDGLSLVELPRSISPTIYLNDYYEEYQKGRTMPEIVLDIVNVYQETRVEMEVDTDFYSDFERVREFVAFKLINYRRNRELLKKVPFVPCMDLAIVFYYIFRDENVGKGTILIHNSHLKMWGITSQELYDTARQNTLKLLPYEFRSMADIMREVMDEPVDEPIKGPMKVSVEEPADAAVIQDSEEENPIPMYVLSNCERNMGAACILYDSVLSQVGEQLGQDYYVLPSSIHECIIVPFNVPILKEDLRDMVREINSTQIPLEEILSDEVYVYDRENHRLSL